jgi:hypothetical protein
MHSQTAKGHTGYSPNAAIALLNSKAHGGITASGRAPICRRLIPGPRESGAVVRHPDLQTILRRGLPQKLFVDNGANYRSKHLALVCAKLGIALIHARPCQPQGKGKIERWFKTVRAPLLTRLTPADVASSRRSTAASPAGSRGVSPQPPPRPGGATPLEQWARTGSGVRLPEPEVDLADLFLTEAVRKVQKDRTVSLNGVVYAVDAALVGENVTLRFDPSAPPERPVQVCFQGQRLALARPVDIAVCRDTLPAPIGLHLIALTELRRRLSSAALAQARQVSAEHVQAAREEVAP